MGNSFEYTPDTPEQIQTDRDAYVQARLNQGNEIKAEKYNPTILEIFKKAAELYAIYGRNKLTCRDYAIEIYAVQQGSAYQTNSVRVLIQPGIEFAVEKSHEGILSVAFWDPKTKSWRKNLAGENAFSAEDMTSRELQEIEQLLYLVSNAQKPEAKSVNSFRPAA
jgi:hypothetical protein